MNGVNRGLLEPNKLVSRNRFSICVQPLGKTCAFSLTYVLNYWVLLHFKLFHIQPVVPEICGNHPKKIFFFFGFSFTLLWIRTEADLKQRFTGQNLHSSQANCKYNTLVFGSCLVKLPKKCLGQFFTPINERLPGEGNNVKLNICQQLLWIWIVVQAWLKSSNLVPPSYQALQVEQRMRCD